MVMKARRKTVILELVDREAITSQEQLREKLRGRGIEATQATLSRDIRELGLVKRAVDGAYRRSGAETPGAGGEATLLLLHRRVRGHGDDWQRGEARVGPQLRGRLVAVHFRHFKINQQQVIFILFEKFKCLGSIYCFINHQFPFLQEPFFHG